MANFFLVIFFAAQKLLLKLNLWMPLLNFQMPITIKLIKKLASGGSKVASGGSIVASGGSVLGVIFGLRKK